MVAAAEMGDGGALAEEEDLLVIPLQLATRDILAVHSSGHVSTGAAIAAGGHRQGKAEKANRQTGLGPEKAFELQSISPRKR